MVERKLVTVETIADLSPIVGADAIETARVRGWNVVVKKNEFAVGDAVLYFEIDSLLPMSDERFAFLAARGTKTFPDGSVAHRLKTAKLRGQYSQGLVMPLSDFPEVVDGSENLAALLGVVKYEPVLPAGTNITGEFPTHLARKTDSERTQNLTDQWDVLYTRGAWVATEKIDGTSLTVAKLVDADLVVAMRNYAIEPGTGVHGRAVAFSGIESLMEPGDVLQAELAGEGIQSNPLKLKGQHIVVFNYMRGGVSLPRDQWPSWVTDSSVAPMVKAVPVYEDLKLAATAEETVAAIDGLKSLLTPGVLTEGVVWYDMSHDAKVSEVLDGRNTFKTISNKFLMKHDG